MKQILVTGGAGFIGSNFIRLMLKERPALSIINLDKLTYAGNLDNLRDVESNPNYAFVQGDVCDRTLLRSLLIRVDGIVHFASETHVDRSIDASDDFLRTNVMGTQALLDEARSAGRIERFVHISTDEVYGSTAQGAFHEDSPMEPSSPYSASKAAADLLVQSYIKTHHFPAVILRGCNNFGPYQYPEKVIPLFVTNLIEKKKLPLYSRGENSREWIYVEDMCRAAHFLLEQGRVGEAYNVGSGFEMTNSELVRQILGIFGLDESWVSYVKDRPAHDLRYRLDTSKLNRLGFAVNTQFREGLQRTADWYRKNEHWWKPLKQDRYTLK